MINAYSRRLTPPYSGQIQIAESDRARVLTMDGENWEIHFCYAANLGAGPDGQNGQRSYRRVAYLDHQELLEIQRRSPQESKVIDPRIINLSVFLATPLLLFPAADRFE